jgi:hypothetical protein
MRMVLFAMGVAGALLGCASAPEEIAALEAELVVLDTDIDGQAITADDVVAVESRREFGTGVFEFEMPSGEILSLTVTPIDDIHVDPYGASGRGREPICVDENGNIDPACDAFPSAGVTAFVMTCDLAGACWQRSGEMDLEIVETTDWRELTFDLAAR